MCDDLHGTHSKTSRFTQLPKLLTVTVNLVLATLTETTNIVRLFNTSNDLELSCIRLVAYRCLLVIQLICVI